MHAVVAHVTIHDQEAALSQLRERVIPLVSGTPGFVAGYWVGLEDGHGTSLVLFDSEQAAREDGVASLSRPEEGLEVDSVEVGEVVATA